MSGERFGQLLARARSAGSVAVIVRLCVEFRPEGELEEAAVRRQRAAIARAQHALLAELSRHRVSSVKRFAYVPYIALAADAGALLRLRASDGVADVTEDASLPAANE